MVSFLKLNQRHQSIADPFCVVARHGASSSIEREAPQLIGESVTEKPTTHDDCNYLMAEISAINNILAELPEGNIIEINNFTYRKKLIESLIAQFRSSDYSQ